MAVTSEAYVIDAVRTARWAGLVKAATMFIRRSGAASVAATASPRLVSGMSVRPVCRPDRLHSVSPCLSRISSPITPHRGRRARRRRRWRQRRPDTSLTDDY